MTYIIHMISSLQNKNKEFHSQIAKKWRIQNEELSLHSTSHKTLNKVGHAR